MRPLTLLTFIPPFAWAQVHAERPPAASKSASQILDENRGSVAVIVAAGNTSLKLGTGFFVRPTSLLLTNFHVVEGMDLVGVKTPGSKGVLWARRAAGFDQENDLVLLEVETNATTPPVALGDSDQAAVGEPIVVIGNPEGLEQTVSNGLLSGIRDVGGRRLFQISAPISEGSSGSPVFNSHGDVIAVVVASLESGQNLNFAVPINYARRLLSEKTEMAISSLPKANQSDTRPESNGTVNAAGPPSVDPVKLAVEATSKVADEIRACEGFSEITPTNERKPHYSRSHWDAPTDVRFDVKATDSLVTPYQGIVEFSIHSGLSPYWRTKDEAASGPDSPMLSITTRHRYFYRIEGSDVKLDYRTYFDPRQHDWVLQQGSSNMCWDHVRAQ